MSTAKKLHQLTSEHIKDNKAVECFEGQYEQFIYAPTDSAQLMSKLVSERNLTLKESKPVLSSSTINVIGYLIGNGVVRKDPEKFVRP